MQNKNENAVPFAVFCPDGFEPKLTLCSMINKKHEQKTGLMGIGSPAELLAILTGSIAAVLKSTEVKATQVLIALIVAAKDAGIDLEEILADTEELIEQLKDE